MVINVAFQFMPLTIGIAILPERLFEIDVILRRKYDAQQVLAAFARTARDEVALDVLADQLQTVVIETLQALHVSVWLYFPKKEQQP